MKRSWRVGFCALVALAVVGGCGGSGTKTVRLGSKEILVVLDDGAISTVNSETGQLEKGFPGVASEVGLSNDRSKIVFVSASQDRLRVFDVSTRTLTNVADVASAQNQMAPQFAQGPDWVAFSGYLVGVGPYFMGHNLANNQFRQYLGIVDGTHLGAFSPNGQNIATWSFGALQLMSSSGQFIRLLDIGSWGYNPVPAWSPDSSEIAYRSEFLNNIVDIKFMEVGSDRSGGGATRTISVPANPKRISFSPNGKQLAILSWDGSLSIVNVDGSNWCSVPTPGQPLRDICWTR